MAGPSTVRKARALPGGLTAARTWRLFTWAVLLAGALIFIFPLFWTTSTALKTYEQTRLVPEIVNWLPKPPQWAAACPAWMTPGRATAYYFASAPQWSNFHEAWTTLPQPFEIFVLNTYVITFLSTLGAVLSSSIVAYGFARFRFKGRNALFLLMLSTMMLPAQVTMIPVFLMWNKLHLVDTFVPLVLPSWFAGAFSVFMLRQFFMTISRELDEAAMIDGCSYFGIWWRIIMPLSRPAVITIVILSFIGGWNDFMGPLIYLNDLKKYTVAIALNMFQDQFSVRLELLMAASLIHILPVIALFFAAQRYFIKGIAMTGLKG